MAIKDNDSVFPSIVDKSVIGTKALNTCAYYVEEVVNSRKAGKDGKDGTNGKSAYEMATENGYTGTEEQFAQKLADIPRIKPETFTFYPDPDDTSVTVTKSFVIFAAPGDYIDANVTIPEHPTEPEPNEPTEPSGGDDNGGGNNNNEPSGGDDNTGGNSGSEPSGGDDNGGESGGETPASFDPYPFDPALEYWTYNGSQVPNPFYNIIDPSDPYAWDNTKWPPTESGSGNGEDDENWATDEEVDEMFDDIFG